MPVFRRIPQFNETLSAREIEVLTLFSDGLGYAEIGARLFIAPVTVKTHMVRIGMKLGSRNRAHSVKLGLRKGYIPLDEPVQP